MRKYLIILFSISLVFKGYSQQAPVVTLAPFLDINTNTRLTGFGEVGVVSSSFYKNTGVYQNPALISKNSQFAGFDITYMPWLTNLTDQLNITSTAGYFALDSSNALALNFTCFNLGHLTLTDEFGVFQDEKHFYEYYLKLGYKYSLNSIFSTGIAIKYFRSNLVSDISNYRPVNAFAVDIGFNYDKTYELHHNSLLNTSAGLAVTNFGPKVSYTDDSEKSFLPAKLSLGVFINPDISVSNKSRLNIELGCQAEKLLVPSVNDNDISTFEALYVSFTDAPGGLQEEIDEISTKFGSEFRFS